MLVRTPEVLCCAKRREKGEGRLQKVANGCRGARGGESDAAGSVLLRANSYLQCSHFLSNILFVVLSKHLKVRIGFGDFW